VDSSERNRVEEALRRYKLLAEHSRDIILHIRLEDGRILEANAAGVRAYGYTRDELLSLSIHDLRAPCTRGETAAQMAEADARSILFETIHQRRDGSTFPVEVSSQGMTVGGAHTLVSIVRDITDSKRVEAELRQQCEWLRVTLASIGDAVLAVDPSGRITFLNPVAVELTGWTEEQALGQPVRRVFRIVDEDTRQPAEDIVARVLREGAVLGLADRTALLTRDGREVPIEQNAAPIRDGAGNVAGVVLVFYDVTGERQVQEALRQSERRGRLKLDSILSPDGDIGNLELEDILDLPAIQSLFDDLHAFVHIPMAIIDLKGKVLVGVGWQDICIKFHRTHPAACGHCIESDTQLAAGAAPGTFSVYKCRNNMWDVATPLMIGGRHLGNLFTGQFFFEGEPVDRELFRSQARHYGFEEEQYLAALDAVPRLSRESVDKVMAFLVRLGEKLSKLSYSNLKLARSLAERDSLMEVRKREQEELRRLNRTLQAQSRSGQALLVATDEVAYLQEICKIIVEDCGHAMVWVGFAEDDEARTVRPSAWAGFEDGYLETLAITWADTERGRGPTGTAIRTGKVCTCGNMLADPLFLPWREQARCRGYASSTAFPLLAEGKAFGALTIYSREPDPFPPDEVRLLSELADDFAYGIKVLRLRAAHEQAEQAARKASDQRRLALEAGELGAWDYHFETGEVFWDERCRNMFGVPAGGQIGYKDVLARVHPDDRAAVDEAIKQAIAGAGGGVYIREHRVVWPDGSVRWVSSSGRVYFEGEGDARRAIRFVGVNMDFTDRKQAEENLHLTQKLESIGLLAGGIAHDFNNLLVGVVGNASLAQDMLPCGSPAAEILKGIVQAGEQAAHLTRQLLAYAGKGRFLLASVNLSELVQETSTLLQSLISKKIALQLQLEPGIAAVLSDPSQMQQIFMNLALNASEAIGSGAGIVSVATGEVDIDAAYIRTGLEGWVIEPGRYVFLEVRDTGCGMDAATKARIFDPFFTTKFQGRGLGLAAVGGIVRAHRGAIKVTTAPGSGSSFRVLLPVMAAGAARSQPVADRKEDLQGHGTLLIVDDEPVVRELAKRCLERQGYNVLVAENGQTAIDIVRSEGHRIQLVVLDLGMPGMSGEETLPHLRALQPDLDVIVSSGYSETETLRLFRGARVSGFIQKPYTVRDLAREVKSALASHSGGRTSLRSPASPRLG
jgi:PAS domain S-box-containing protein